MVKDTRPLTAEEVNAMLIRQQVNSLAVDDNTALRMREFYPDWEDMIGQTVEKAGFRFKHGGNLYKTIPADPIPYSGNMALEAGRYYSQSGVVYLCTRDTVNPVYNALADLVGLYVEIP